MKVVILAGGFGTRIRDVAEDIPKPMIPIGPFPILWYIMNTYSKFGHTDFIICLGYKGQLIKDFFLNYKPYTSDFTISFGENGDIQFHNKSHHSNWTVTLVDTGLKSKTGSRISRIRDFIGQEDFMLTYGDGVANIDINKLIKFHKNHGKMVTLTAVRPAARFGELKLDNDKVLSFKEKPQLHEGWINGGFFVMEPGFIEFIEGDHIMLEREPLVAAANQGELMSFRHDGFWQCMDTKRDHELLTKLWNKKTAPWVK